MLCAGSDDTNGSGQADTLTFDGVAGQTYFIIVDGSGTSSGPYTLLLIEDVLPAPTDTITPGAANVCPPPVQATTFADVWPIYKAECATCHTVGGSGGLNIGHAVLATAHSDSQKAAYTITGTEGAATLVRIKNGSMPLGGGCSGDPAADAGKANCLTADEQAKIQAWLDAGQPAPAAP